MRSKPVLPYTVIASLAVASAALIGACAPEGEREPRLEANSAWTAPEVEELDGVQYVQNAAAEARLQVRQAEGPVEATHLLFWGDQAVARDAAGFHFAANTEDHEVLMFDAELNFLGALLPQGPDGDRLQRPVTIAAGSDERLAAFEAAGTVLIFDRWGREFVRLETPFAYAVGVWGPDAQLTLARSPFTVAFAFEGEDPPLLATLDPANPEGAGRIGTAREALSPVYIHAANAGTVALDEQGNVYYAALGWAEVEKYERDGNRVWVSRRPAGFETPEPRFVQNPDGPPRLLLATVQKAAAFGPDGLLYIRSAAGSSATRDRLDVLHPETGAWLRSAALDTGTAVLVGRRGAVWEAPRAALLVERTRERRPFQSFALETFDGDSLRLEELRGKVALVTFWASWCTPCQEELPLLDSLDAAVDRPDFELIGIAEDVKEEDARQFAEDLGLRMTLLLGHGRMRQRYHYSGLPYSVLLDREGRVVKEYYGFGGREPFDREVAGRVLATLGTPDRDAEADMAAARTRQGVGGESTAPTAEDHRAHGHEHGEVSNAEDQATGHHHGTESGPPPIAHSHGPAREVTGREIGALAGHVVQAKQLNPSMADDVPSVHWETVEAGLAQVDAESNVFMERFSGTFPLVQLLTLKTQLYVDIERLPELHDADAFPERWAEHLSAIEYLLEAYQELRDQLPDTAT